MDENTILNCKKFLMQINSIPFYYKSHKLPDNGGKPHILPFQLFYDERFEMFKQVPSIQLEKILEEVYIDGSLVDGSVSSESGLHYVTPILDYIFKNCLLSTQSRVLEIGFGSGVFLKKLKELGYNNLVGIEPGGHLRIDGLDDVQLYNDFYPTVNYSETVDLIFHSLVLEHIKDPHIFLSHQAKQLNENGKIIFFVPNEEPFLFSGDCSSFIHEHYNYFTRRSLALLVNSLEGLYLEDISIIGGLLGVTISKRETKKYKADSFEKFDNNFFFSLVEANLNKLVFFLKQFHNESDVAIYAPCRALNIMYLLDKDSYRLVDDSTEVHNRYLPFFKKPIESFASICSNPPKSIIIFSRTFGTSIKQKCLSRPELSQCLIHIIDEL